MVAHHCMAHPCPLCFPHLVYTLPPSPTCAPQGCICPPTSEKTCEAIACPRRNPFKSGLSGSGVVGGVR